MFSMGRIQRRTPEERRRHRQAQRRRVAQQQRTALPPPPAAKSWSTLFYQSWNLLPQEKFTNKGLYYSMSFNYPSFAYRYAHFMNFSTWIGKQKDVEKQCPHILDLQEEAKEKFFLNQQLRFQFKRIVSSFLLKKIQLKNEVDPITMEVPIHTVILYDHTNRCKFRFEARELLRDFSTRLLTHEDLFPTPLFLRNPLTNSRLHLGQLISVYSQIKSFGQMHWTLECLQDARFAMGPFVRDNSRKLRLSALRNLMKSSDGNLFLLDFIEAQHDILNKPFDLRTYQWALKNNKCYSMDRIRSWRALCYTFYEIEITEEDLFERQRKMSKLTPIVQNLCTPAIEIQMVKRTHTAPKP